MKGTRLQAAMLLGALLLGCGPAALPSPVIRSVSPSTRDSSESGDVSVQVSAVLPFHVDYGRGQLTADPSLTLKIGPWVLGNGHETPSGVVTGTLPSGLPAGTYDVTLALSDGRSAVLPGAFTIRPGRWPLAYVFDDIPSQQSGRPFGITVRALGGNASTFHGNVTFSAEGNATVTPALSNAFVNGFLVQTVAVQRDQGGNQLRLTVTDPSGASGHSNKFDVN